MSSGPTNNAPVSQRSKVAHLPGAKEGDKVKDGRDYSVEFDDALMEQDGWRNPRDRGCKLTSLYLNKYSDSTETYGYGPPKHQHLQHTAPYSQSWAGDIINEQDPVVESHSCTIFYGETIAGWQEDKRYPNVGPGFSYVFLTKAYTFNPHTNDFFITEMLDPDDQVFERVVKQDLRYGDKFSLRLISEGVEHDLEDEYTVHWNKGLFSLIATYESCSEYPFSHPQQLVSSYVSPRDSHHYYGRTTSPSTENANHQLYTLFKYNTNPKEQREITGSFIIEKNPDTWWWRRPQTSSFFDVTYVAGHPVMSPSNSASGDLELNKLSQRNQGTGSMYTFMSRLMSLPHNYIKGPQSESIYWKRQQGGFGSPPAREDLHIITFNGAQGCVKEIQTEIQYDLGVFGWFFGFTKLQNTTQALRHFGSISISPGSLIGVPNIDRGLTDHRVDTSTNMNSFDPSYFYTTTGAPAFNDYVVESNYATAAPNAGEVTYYNWFANNAIFKDTYANKLLRPDWLTGSPPVTGSGVLSKAPHLDSWTISKLEKRKNVIMADISKQKQLFEGTGNSGFVVIPENLHPSIKSNMDYYLRKAHLKDRGPRRKNLFSKRPRFIRRTRIRKPNFLNPFKILRRKFKRFRWL